MSTSFFVSLFLLLLYIAWRKIKWFFKNFSKILFYAKVLFNFSNPRLYSQILMTPSQALYNHPPNIYVPLSGGMWSALCKSLVFRLKYILVCFASGHCLPYFLRADQPVNSPSNHFANWVVVFFHEFSCYFQVVSLFIC